jgi:hypothetical protein
LRWALFGSIPVYEEKMPEAAGRAGIVSPHVLYERTASSGRGDKLGKRIQQRGHGEHRERRGDQEKEKKFDAEAMS